MTINAITSPTVSSAASSTTSSTADRGSSNRQSIEENSTFMKFIPLIISCIPVIGIISSEIQERSLCNRVNIIRRGDPEADAQCIKLTKERNQYQIACIVRDLFSIALIIGGIAFCTLKLTPAAIYIGLILGFDLLLRVCYINHNNQDIARMESSINIYY